MLIFIAITLFKLRYRKLQEDHSPLPLHRSYVIVHLSLAFKSTPRLVYLKFVIRIRRLNITIVGNVLCKVALLWNLSLM